MCSNAQVNELRGRITKKRRQVRIHFRVHANIRRSTDTLACGPALEPQQSGEDSTIADNSASSGTCTAQ